MKQNACLDVGTVLIGDLCLLPNSYSNEQARAQGAFWGWSTCFFTEKKVEFFKEMGPLRTKNHMNYSNIFKNEFFHDKTLHFIQYFLKTRALCFKIRIH